MQFEESELVFAKPSMKLGQDFLSELHLVMLYMRKTQSRRGLNPGRNISNHASSLKKDLLILLDL